MGGCCRYLLSPNDCFALGLPASSSHHVPAGPLIPFLRPLPAPSPNTDVLDGCKIGDKVPVEVLRGGRQKKTLIVHLAERQLEPSE